MVEMFWHYNFLWWHNIINLSKSQSRIRFRFAILTYFFSSIFLWLSQLIANSDARLGGCHWQYWVSKSYHKNNLLRAVCRALANLQSKDILLRLFDASFFTREIIQREAVVWWRDKTIYSNFRISLIQILVSRSTSLAVEVGELMPRERILSDLLVAILRRPESTYL